MMIPKHAPLSLVCYRDVDLVPHQKAYIKYCISKSHCIKMWKMRHIFFCNNITLGFHTKSKVNAVWNLGLLLLWA